MRRVFTGLKVNHRGQNSVGWQINSAEWSRLLYPILIQQTHSHKIKETLYLFQGNKYRQNLSLAHFPTRNKKNNPPGWNKRTINSDYNVYLKIKSTDKGTYMHKYKRYSNIILCFLIYIWKVIVQSNKICADMLIVVKNYNL